MQDYQDNEKKTIKNYRKLAIMDFISAKFVMGYPCVSLHIFALFLSYVSSTSFLKFKMAAKRPF